MLAREAIYAALFAAVSAVSGLRLTSRRLQHWADVPPEQQPALFMAQTMQRADYAPGRTVMWHLGATLYLYVRDPEGSIPGQTFNALLDGVSAALAPDNAMTNACTLGGLVHWARMGEIETDEGTLGEQAVARIPVEMFAVG